jgi:DsbC/DsbD-like thiol-disulfide interchange protein
MSAFRTAIAAAILSIAILSPAAGPSAQTSVAATPWAEQHSARVRLVVGRAKSAEGQYLAGLEIAMADGWKTYWRMPGDSGVPPTFDWAGSGNIASTRILYPAPMRMPEAGGVAIGYKRSVLLPIEITPQDASKPIILKLALEFGVCREICIPATANFDLSVPAAPVGAPAPQIAAAIERVPRPQASRRNDDPELKRVTVSHNDPSPKLTIEASFAGDATGADAFIEAPEGIYVPMPKRVGADAGGVVRFETDLGRHLAQELTGKTLTFTLVSDAGATEAQWVFP